jgi:hypothetical protein
MTTKNPKIQLPFKKIIHPCDVPIHNGRKYPMFCKVEFTGGKLTISGVIGPTQSGNAMGGCGQIDINFRHKNPEHNDKRTDKPLPPRSLRFAPGWTADMWLTFLEYWHDWHLNDLRPGCEHQIGADWNTDKELELINYKWSSKFYNMRTRAEEGKLTAEEYELYKSNAALVDAALFGLDKPKYETPKIKQLLKDGWIEEEKRTKKTAGWVKPIEHPEGLLTKPCPVCGYKYGSAWRMEKVPAEVLDFLRGLPDTDRQPNWV